MRRKKLVTLIGGVCLVLVLAMMPFMTACPAPAEEEEEVTPPEPVKIGVDTALTGKGAYFGTCCLDCWKFWADEKNAEGGLLVAGVRHPVKIIAEDSRSTPDGAVASAEKLISQDKVKIIVGTVLGANFKPILPLTTRNKVLTIGLSEEAKHTLSEYPYYAFIMQSSPRFVTTPMLEWFMENKGVTNIYRVYENSAYPVVRMHITEEIAAELGLAFTSAAYEVGTTDFYPFVTPIVAANPDLVDVGWTTPEDGALLTEALRGLGYEGIIFAEGGPSPKDMVDLVGAEVVEGFYMSGRGVSAEESWTSEKKERVARWEAKYGEGSFRDIHDYYLPTCYLLGMAIEKAGTIDNVDRIIEALEEVEYKDPADKTYPIIKFAGEETYGVKRVLNMWNCLGWIHNGDFDASTRIVIMPELP